MQEVKIQYIMDRAYLWESAKYLSPYYLRGITFGQRVKNGAMGLIWTAIQVCVGIAVFNIPASATYLKILLFLLGSMLLLFAPYFPFIMIVLPIVQYFQLRKSINRVDEADLSQKPIEVVFNDHGITVTSKEKKSEYSWSGIVRLLVVPSGMVIQLSTAEYMYLRESFFDSRDSFDTVVERFSDNGVGIEKE